MWAEAGLSSRNLLRAARSKVKDVKLDAKSIEKGLAKAVSKEMQMKK